MALTPWHKSATPREDLRKGKPMDAAEFAVNLDRVRDGKAPDDYKYKLSAIYNLKTDTFPVFFHKNGGTLDEEADRVLNNALNKSI